MSDIRERIEAALDDVYEAGFKDTSSYYGITRNTKIIPQVVDQILALIPRWQSFEEAKPEVGEEILVKSNSGDISFIWFEYDHEINNYEILGYQWLRIPE